MKLITKAIEKITPKIGANRDKSAHELTFYFKLFTPWSQWTWYVAEYDPETQECFGLVDGFEKELGYFSLTELSEVRSPRGLKIERDFWFDPIKYDDLMQKLA